MSVLTSAWLVPHPPIVIPEVGAGRERPAHKTIAALQEMAEAVCAEHPQALVVLTPHGEASGGGPVISTAPVLKGSMLNFGAPGCALEFATAEPLAEAIIAEAEAKNLSLQADGRAKALDHGAFVPLYFLHQAGCRAPIVHIAVGDPMFPQHKLFGQAIHGAVSASGLRTALIVSGDLSHRLAHDGPYGYSAAGMAFEEEMDRIMRAGTLAALDGFTAAQCYEAAQCGLGPLKIASGAVAEAQVRVLSHEWPFGVGYMVAQLKGGKGDACAS